MTDLIGMREETCTPKETYTPNYIHLGVTSLLKILNILRYLIIQYLIFDSKSNKQHEDYVAAYINFVSNQTHSLSLHRYTIRWATEKSQHLS